MTPRISTSRFFGGRGRLVRLERLDADDRLPPGFLDAAQQRVKQSRPLFLAQSVEAIGEGNVAEGEFEPLNEEQRAASLHQTLERATPGGDVWLFGYGSLMWNPIFHYEERRKGRLFGYHRSYCMWIRWGGPRGKSRG